MMGRIEVQRTLSAGLVCFHSVYSSTHSISLLGLFQVFIFSVLVYYYAGEIPSFLSQSEKFPASILVDRKTG